MDDSTILETRDLRRQFGGLVAVDGVSMKVQAHTLHTIIGPNGAGKTTFFNLLSGNIRPSSGRVLFKGQDITRHDQYVYKNLGYNFAHRKIEPLYVTIPVGANHDMVPNSHDGQEFDYILSGTMRLRVCKNEVVLKPGDSVYYDSRTPHALQAVGEEPVHFLAMVIP